MAGEICETGGFKAANERVREGVHYGNSFPLCGTDWSD